MIYWELFRVFFLIGAFTFGGGYAMIAMVQQQVVTFVLQLFLTANFLLLTKATIKLSK